MSVSLILIEVTWLSLLTVVSLQCFGIIKRDQRISMSAVVNYMPYSELVGAKVKCPFKTTRSYLSGKTLIQSVLPK